MTRTAHQLIHRFAEVKDALGLGWRDAATEETCSANRMCELAQVPLGEMSYSEYQKDPATEARLRVVLAQGGVDVGASPRDLPPVEALQETEIQIEEDRARCRLITPDLVKNDRDLFEQSGLDPNEWRVTKLKVKAYAQGQKSGDGEPVAIQLWSVSADLEHNREGRQMQALADVMYEAAQQAAPVHIVQMPGPRSGTPHLLKVNIADLHIGKYCDPSLTGETWDVEEAVDLHSQVVRHFMEKASATNIEQVLLYAGNDIVHDDNLAGQTTSGTQVAERDRHMIHYAAAWNALKRAVYMLHEMAPVTVQIIPGNHDRNSDYKLGHALASHFEGRGMHVDVDWSLAERKYYRYGVSLFGGTHGDNTKHTALPSLMAHEAKEWWGQCHYYEYDTGHFHSRKSYRPNQHEEVEGVLVRVNPALCPPDVWHISKGYVMALRSAVARAYSKTNGYADEYGYNILPETCAA